MTILQRLAAGVGLAAGMALAAPAATAAEKLVYASYISEVYTISKTDLWFMEEVKKRSNGEITFETYFSGSLLKASDLFPGLQNAAADMVMGAPAAYNRQEYPLSNIVLPYITSKADAVAKALGDFYAESAALRQEYEGRNAKVLYILPFAENTLWSKAPITKAEDFKGLKVRALLSIADSIQILGGTPVAMAWPDALEALQRGIVDAMSSAPFDSAVLGGMHEVAQYGSDGGGMGIYATSVTALSLDRYEAMSEAHRKIIDEVAAEAPAYKIALLDKELDRAAQKLCDHKGNLKVTLFSEAEAAKVRDVAAEAVQRQWVEWVGKATDADGQAMLDRYLELVSRYDAESTWKPGFARYVAKGCGQS